MTKTNRLLLALFMSSSILLGTVSLFLPYLVKVNRMGGDLTLPQTQLGYQYGLSSLLLVIMTATLIFIASERKQIVSVILSSTVLILVWLVRYSIHFKGFIDHDYDSKTGTGFLLLFIAAIAHFIFSLSALFLQNRKLRNQQ